MIKPLQPHQASAVAKLHLDYLQTNYRGRLGHQLLTAYYRAVCNSRGGVGYVWVDDENVLGYVCGIWDRRRILRKLLQQSAMIVIGGTIAHWIYYSRSLPPAREDDLCSYELRPIVVDAAARGRGIAQQLTTRLLEDAATRGYTCVHLKTEVHNHIAKKFYLKVGFELMQRVGDDENIYFKMQL